MQFTQKHKSLLCMIFLHVLAISHHTQGDINVKEYKIYVIYIDSVKILHGSYKYKDVDTVDNELSKLDFDIVALQETWLESGIQKFDNFALFNSISESKKNEFGCGFYVRGEFLKYVEDFEILNERICYLRLKTKWFSCTLINVHAPTDEKNRWDKTRIL